MIWGRGLNRNLFGLGKLNAVIARKTNKDEEVVKGQTSVDKAETIV